MFCLYARLVAILLLHVYIHRARFGLFYEQFGNVKNNIKKKQNKKNLGVFLVGESIFVL